jgi:branched-chain amino acid transport system permease protein
VDWVNAVLQGLLLGGLYALFAAGLSLMFGVMRIVNLAHGDLAIMGAFLAYSLGQWLGLNPFVACALIVPAMFVVGFALQTGMFNAALRGGELGPLLATFGLSVVLQNGLQQIYSADQRGLTAGHIDSANVHLGSDIVLGWLPLLTLAIGVVVVAGLHLLLERTQLGRAFRAVADDPEAASVVGIDQRRLFAIAAGFALATVGLAGVLLGIRTTFAPSDGPAYLIFAFEAVIIGGLGNVRGTLLGGMVLGVAQAVGGQIDPSWSILAGHLVFLGILVVRPRGLVPKAGLA